ncbi:MAG TPA: aldo/keto reductase, partial [Ilumatobacteraceae bacterium]
MEHVRFGRTGLKVSRLCLGTMTFGYQCDDETSFAIMDAAADAGVTFFDTADAYPLGASRGQSGRTEELIGQWLGSRRDEFIIASKCFFPTGKKPWDMGNSRKNILRALEASLRRLDTDYVDLYQLHSWDTETPIDETLQALDDVVRSGKVRYVGCSNFLAYQLARSIGRAEVLGTVNFVSVQPRYNLLFRENERELLPLCLEEGIAVIPYNPLAGGFLSGKHQPGAPTEGGRFTLGTAADRYQERYWHDRMFKTVDELRPVAQAAGVSMATMAVQWVLA